MGEYLKILMQHIRRRLRESRWCDWCLTDLCFLDGDQTHIYGQMAEKPFLSERVTWSPHAKIFFRSRSHDIFSINGGFCLWVCKQQWCILACTLQKLERDQSKFNSIKPQQFIPSYFVVTIFRRSRISIWNLKTFAEYSDIQVNLFLKETLIYSICTDMNLWCGSLNYHFNEPGNHILLER